jgi:hypothetical protein
MLPYITRGTVDRFIINNNKTLQSFFLIHRQYRFIESKLVPKDHQKSRIKLQEFFANRFQVFGGGGDDNLSFEVGASACTFSSYKRTWTIWHTKRTNAWPYLILIVEVHDASCRLCVCVCVRVFNYVNVKSEGTRNISISTFSGDNLNFGELAT